MSQDKHLSSLCLQCGFRSSAIDVERCPTCKQSLTSIYEDPNPDICRECTLKLTPGKGEVYSVSDDRYGSYAFDVHRIKEDIAFLRKTFPAQIDKYIATIPKEYVANMLFVNVTEPKHYDHVTSTEPGIVVVIERPEGTMLCLVDGNHRAGKCLRDGQPFKAYVLPWENAKRYLITLQDHEVKEIQNMTMC
jgi:hypothetical protein